MYAWSGISTVIVSPLIIPFGYISGTLDIVSLIAINGVTKTHKRLPPVTVISIRLFAPDPTNCFCSTIVIH